MLVLRDTSRNTLKELKVGLRSCLWGNDEQELELLWVCICHWSKFVGQHSVFVDLSECRSTTLASTFQEDAHRHMPVHMQHSAITDIYYVWHAVYQTCNMSDIAMSVIGAMSDIHMSDGCHAGTRCVWLIERCRQALTLHIVHIWALWLSISLVKPFWASNSVETWLLET